jgi:hypothetical protein
MQAVFLCRKLEYPAMRSLALPESMTRMADANLSDALEGAAASRVLASCDELELRATAKNGEIRGLLTSFDGVGSIRGAGVVLAAAALRVAAVVGAVTSIVWYQTPGQRIQLETLE